MGQYRLAEVGTSWHTLKLSFNSNHVDVYCDDLANAKISVSDTTGSPYLDGSVSLEMWNSVEPGEGPSYNMSVDDIVVTPLQ